MSTSSTVSFANEGLILWINRNGHKEQIQLSLELQQPIPQFGIGETESVSFVLQTSTFAGNAVLWVEDIALEPTSFHPSSNFEGFAEYTWLPETPLFRNHFGWCHIMIEVSTPQGQQFFHATLDIFATKLNEVQVRGMLQYLEVRMEDITRSCFTATSQQTGSLSGTCTLLVLLQEIENQLLRLHSLLPRFQRRKRSRLTPKSVVTSFNEATNFTEKSLAWVLSHPDEFVLSSSPLPSSISFRNRYYDLFEVENETLVEDTDVYENQIISGYLQSLESRLGEIDRYAQGLQVSPQRADYISIPTGFVSFSRIQKEYEQRFCAKIRKKCQLLQTVRLDCASFFEKYLPVTHKLPEMPKMTPGFLSSPHYQELFQQIIAWYRLGKLTVLGERYLYGLRTLDKLYEFFCLYRILEALGLEGWSLTTVFGPRIQSSELVWDTAPDKQYVFHRLGGERIRLFYDSLIYNRPAAAVNLMVTEFSVSRHRSIRERRPDFLIEVVDENTEAFIILDAKYSTHQMVWEQYLPQLTMNYIHGIGSTSGGLSPVVALFLLYPRAKNEGSDGYDLFHQQATDLFSNHPSIPVLGTVQVSPDSSPPSDTLTVYHESDSDHTEDQESVTKPPFPLAKLLARTLAIAKQSVPKML